MIIVDASVAVKWFLPEDGADAATQLFELDNIELAGPDILAVEVCATLVRGANIVKANRHDALITLGKFNMMLDAGDVTLLRTSTSQIHSAARYAIDLGHPLRDCIYLALAVELGCELLTADARFAARASAICDRVRILGT